MNLTKLTGQISKIKVKNVVDMPLFYGLWVLAFTIISATVAKQEWLTIGLFCIACLLFLTAGFGYVFFSLTTPDYLRSEEYHLKKQSLEIMGDKENILPIGGEDIVSITKPYPNQLSEGEAENN